MFFKMPVEIGKIFKATLVTDLRDAVISLHQQPAGVADPYFCDIIGKGLPGMVFEITGKRGDAHI